MALERRPSSPHLPLLLTNMLRPSKRQHLQRVTRSKATRSWEAQRVMRRVITQRGGTCQIQVMEMVGVMMWTKQPGKNVISGKGTSKGSAIGSRRIHWSMFHS